MLERSVLVCRNKVKAGVPREVYDKIRRGYEAQVKNLRQLAVMGGK